MNKRIVSIALAAAMTSALFLSGCGSDSGSTTATTAPPPPDDRRWKDRKRGG